MTIEMIMKLKQLDLNVSKSSYIVCQKSSKAKDIQEELKNDPLTYDGIEVKEKQSEKYLGDMIDGRGLSESIAATIEE